MQEILDKKSFDISQKDCIVNNDEAVKIPREEVIKVLKILEGLKRTLLKAIKHDI